MLSWYSAGYGGWDHMAAGMEVDVAGGLEMLRTIGFA